MKKCSKCGEIFPDEEFYISRWTNKPFGGCRACRKISNDKWRIKRRELKIPKIIFEEEPDWDLVNKLNSLLKPNLDYNKRLFRNPYYE